jgi:organic radical activating enzyme
VDADKVRANPRLLHNTPEKKDDRAKMQRGERPAGCEYCWKIEDMGRDAVSDRVYKSKIYPIEALHEARNLPSDTDINLRTLEIAFDRTCQFACSYCNPAFSTTWVNDIKHNGAYNGLVSDGRNHFTHTHSSSQLFKITENNPYVDAFFAWWESDLHKTLQELRITGGEPLMSGHTWRLIDWFRDNRGRSKTRLAINSNLGAEVDVDRLIASTQGLNVEIYTSMESVGAAAEYIRDGLDYSAWQANVRKLLDAGITVHCMCTINSLCLPGLVDHLNYLLELKQLYGRNRVNFTLNILRFPSFQSPLVLSDALRTQYRDQLTAWLHSLEVGALRKYWHLMHEHELNHTQRLVDYLDVVKTPHSDAFEMPKLLNDFQQFFQQYDQRRNKDFELAFPELKEWYNNL